jgi:hypothetical protein
LKVQERDDPHGRQERHAVLRDGLGAWHSHLKHAGAHVTASSPERLLDLFRAHRETRDRRPGRRTTDRRRAGRQRLAQGPGTLHGVAVSLVVHVHHVGEHLVQVIVDRGHLEPPVEEARHRRRALLIEEHQIAHDHRVIPDLPEGGAGAEREARLHRYPLHGHREIGARHPDAEHVAGLELTRLPSACSTAFQSGSALPSAVTEQRRTAMIPSERF